MSKILVLYYSYEGNTKLIAEAIAEATKADICRIIPSKEMDKKGFSKYLWGGYQVMMGQSPKIKPLDRNPQDYDLIFLGSPIWASSYAPPIKTILEGNYFNNKKVCYFHTGEGESKGAFKKAEIAINKNNKLISSLGLLNVKANPEKNTKEAKEWAIKQNKK